MPGTPRGATKATHVIATRAAIAAPAVAMITIGDIGVLAGRVPRPIMGRAGSRGAGRRNRRRPRGAGPSAAGRALRVGGLGRAPWARAPRGGCRHRTRLRRRRRAIRPPLRGRRGAAGERLDQVGATADGQAEDVAGAIARTRRSRPGLHDAEDVGEAVVERLRRGFDVGGEPGEPAREWAQVAGDRRALGSEPVERRRDARRGAQGRTCGVRRGGKAPQGGGQSGSGCAQAAGRGLQRDRRTLQRAERAAQ